MAKRDDDKAAGRAGTVVLEVAATLLETEGREEVPKAYAYAFDSGGRLLDRKPIEKGGAKLTVPVGEEGRALRVLVGGDVGQDAIEELRPAQLLRRGAEERVVRVSPRLRPGSIEFFVPPEGWACWLRGLCLVRGNLVKRTERDGAPLDLPVCHAKVEIFEVDPIWVILPKLRIPEIQKIRDVILGKIPLPDPPPERFTFDAARFEDPGVAAAVLPKAFARVSPQPEPPSLEAFPAELALAARSASVEALRGELALHPRIVVPIFCYLYPHLVTMRKVGEAETDDCGAFRIWLLFGCNNTDQPDLYFKASQKIFGFDLPIYAPTPIYCHTHWNYACGTSVTLVTRNPLARTCSPCAAVDAPPMWVLPLAVGNTRLDRIRGTSPALQATTNPANRGLLADGGTDRPFGGLCRLRIEFDAADLRAAGFRYYRVGWRKGTSGAFTDLSGSVVRHYHHEVGDDLELEVFPLGPRTVGTTPNLFEIPPPLPPEGTWSQPDVVEDSTSAKFPTHLLPPFGDPTLTEAEEMLAQAGKYQLRIELFDTAGHKVEADSVRWRVPNGEDADGTVHTADAAPLGLVSDHSFIMTLHVDNNRCSADIGAPQVAGASADDDCGVLVYDADADPAQSCVMGFSAAHPNGFATYSFVVNRGIHNVVSESAPVPGGSVTRAIDGDFLGPCAGVTGGVAAYAEHLYVTALATDGWSRLSGYDASDLRAFVLTPAPE